MEIEFVSSVAAIAPDPATSNKLYVDALGLPLKGGEAEPEYVHSEEIEGLKHLGIWPLSHAAKACFGTDEWPADRPVPQASIEFEVKDAGAVADAAAELEGKGYEMIHGAVEQPWGQTVARLQAVEGTIVGISFAPWMHE
jgi:catechol 2,3-dioxygenase-like lactoylglutathione lyase family enzyme